MIKFHGRLSFKQFCLRKPNKFDIKVFLLCDSRNRHTYNFDIYSGKRLFDRTKGLPYKIVMDLLDRLANKGHCLYADNYFSALQLLQDLEQKMIGFLGTLRQNSKGLHSQMRPKRDKNLTEFDSHVFKNGNTLTILWKDKNLVRFLTNTIRGNIFVERRAKGHINPLQAKKPKTIDDYNRYKFGVDLANQLLSAYIFDHKSLKWWKRIIYFST